MGRCDIVSIETVDITRMLWISLKESVRAFLVDDKNVADFVVLGQIIQIF